MLDGCTDTHMRTCTHRAQMELQTQTQTCAQTQTQTCAQTQTWAHVHTEHRQSYKHPEAFLVTVASRLQSVNHDVVVA